MFRGFVKLLLLILVVVALGAFLLGWWGSGRVYNADETRAVGTVGVDKAKARETGAKVGEKAAEAADRTAQAAEVAADKTAEAASQARKALAEGGITAKIKAKMALDDHVKALNLNVDTVGSVVTLSGSVTNEMERERALELARDTEGVTQVIDKLTVKR